MYIIISSSGPPVLKIGGSLEFYEFSQHSYQDYISRRTIAISKVIDLYNWSFPKSEPMIEVLTFYNRLGELQLREDGELDVEKVHVQIPLAQRRDIVFKGKLCTSSWAN